ncbi:hypothetical protein Z043_102586 [Scleropages formosus]|uniref:VPS9 domain-containing protein n=1 Tax=Scleropages formosus TaxID=113540 RepID=A0A0P7XRD2_SCLFO|nr:hypothetical protein Z043_102586 [Scleropages formosus]
MLELAIHKALLKPVQTYLYASLLDYRNRDGSMQRLKENQNTMGKQNPEALGAAEGAGLPDAVILEKIQQRWASMHQAYSPTKKVQILLKVCKSIYHSMSANSSPACCIKVPITTVRPTGAAYGADDFLPCLTWVILRSDISILQLDTDYMMELLDPAQLQGEGGYYLTSLYGSLFHISSFRSRFATRQLSSEAQRSLSQWHRRRTLHCDRSRRTGNRRTIRKLSSRERAGPQTEAELQDRRMPPDSPEEERETRASSASQADMHHKAEGGLEDVKEEEDSRPEGPAEECHGNARLKSAERGPESEESVEVLRTTRGKPAQSPKKGSDGRPWSEPRGHEALWAVHEDTDRDSQDKKEKALSRLST